jgi:hypothetical protein
MNLTAHFFNNYFRPENFLINIVNFNGGISFEEFRSSQLEEYLVDKTPAVVIRVIRIFAWSVLLIGFSIIIWIIYAMIFAYK